MEVLPPADVLATLAASAKVEAVILDPWYNKGIGGERGDYDNWLASVIDADAESPITSSSGASPRSWPAR